MGKRRGRSADGRSRDPGKRRPPPPPPQDDESETGSQSSRSAIVEHLSYPGERPKRDRIYAQVHRIVRDVRESCGQCRYRRICAFGPIKYQIDYQADQTARHRHAGVLKSGLREIAALGGDWQNALIAMLTGREKDALLAGCLLSVAYRKRPEAMIKLIDYASTRCDVDTLKAEAAELTSRDEMGLAPGQGIDPDALQCRMFRGQVIRMASFSINESVLRRMQDLLVLGGDDDGRLFQYEAVGVLALLVGRQLPADKWIRSLEKDISGPFRATFATRAPGNGGLDLFFPYRRGKRRSYLYLRRSPDGTERLSSVDKVRIDSLLHRMFLVFAGDAMKIHRIFKELCRHLNVRAGEYNVNHVLSGFERLEHDDLLLLGIYAPALARAVGHYLGIPEYHTLVKFLYGLRTESGRRGGEPVAAHEKVVQAREQWTEVIEILGKDTVKSVFAVLFRLNSSYKKRVYTTTTYLKIGEVAYLLTAMSGWNPKGLEIELKQARKALAFVAYGLQPPGKWSKIRVGKMRRALERTLDKDNETLERACGQGMQYMAVLHGFRSFAELEADSANEGWSARLSAFDLPAHIDASAEDFSEFEDSGDSLVVNVDEDADLFIVVDDDQASESGRLKTQRMPKQHPPRFYEQDDDDLESDEDDISGIIDEDDLFV